MTDYPKKSKVLIVDDTPENIHVLIEALKDEYIIVAAKDGEKALQLANSEPSPDVILLDIMMPGMDGYEVCARLKENNKTIDIPVIFITAKSEIEDEIKGLDLGAVDYITKPISPPIVKARVKTHLSLKKAREILKIQNEELVKAAQLKEDVDRIMRHDLKSPLTSIISLPGIMMQERNFDPQDIEDLQTIEESGYRMLNMINLSLDLFKMERGTYEFLPVPVDLPKVIKKILSEVKGIAQSKKISLNIDAQNDYSQPEDGSLLVSGDELLCYSMFSNLIKNAVEASPEKEVITVSFERKEQGCVSIHNQGLVPEEIADKFFEKYATAGKSGGTGLGTYSAKLMAETQEGNITLESSGEKGTTITVCLPLYQDQNTVESGDEEQHVQAANQHGLESHIQSIPSIKLLMVDDDKDLLAMLKLKLEKTGKYNVVISTEGSKAVELACNAAPDLIVLDIDMPEMDGGSVAHTLSESEDTRGIPILFLSSLVPAAQVKESNGVIGGRNMASKKGSIQDLIDRIDTMVQ